MSVPLLQVDAFTDRVFTGNPAGVCLLTDPAHAGLRGDAEWMQALAGEMNLSETAYVWPLPTDGADAGVDLRLRWFTPGAEVDLCGHATLATAHAIWTATDLAPDRAELRFHTRSGVLTVRPGPERDAIEMDFPADPPEEARVGEPVLDALGLHERNVLWCGQTRYKTLLHLEATRVLAVEPSFERLRRASERAVIITGQGAATPSERLPTCDFVSRMFAPGWRVNEDPVTGAAHCVLSPYWSGRLGRDELLGYQASERGGFVRTRLCGDRVVLSGTARTVFRASLEPASLPQASTSK